MNLRRQMTPWLLWSGVVTLSACMGALELAPDDSNVVLTRHALDAPSPLERGHLKDAFSLINTMQESLAQRYQTERFG